MNHTETVEPQAGEKSGETRKQVRGSAMILAGRGISIVLNFVVQVLAVRYLSKIDYGAFAYALSAVEITSRIALFGMDRAASRFVAIYHEKKDTARVLGSLLLMGATVVCVGLGLVVGVLGFRGLLGSRLVTDPLSLALLLSLIVLAPVEALNYLLQSVFSVFVRARMIFFRRYVVGPCLKLAAVLFVVAAGGDVRMLAGVYVVAGLIGLAIGFALLKRVLDDAGLLGAVPFSGWTSSAGEIFSFGVPMMLSDVSFMMRSTIVVFLLEFFHGAASVADFRAVYPVARLNRSVFESFVFLFVPMMARLLVREDRRALDHLFWRSTVWVTVLSFPGFVATFSLAKPVTVLLFGSRYQDSAPILTLLSLSLFFGAVLGLNAMALRAAGKVRQVVTVDAVAMVLLVGLSVVLIPRFRGVGGAVSALSVTVFQTVMYQFQLRRVTGIRVLPAEYAPVFATVAAAAAALFLVQALWSPPMYVGAGLVVVATIAVLFASARKLEVGETFPELLRVPLVRRAVAVLERRSPPTTPSP